ncbi:hypothetical protein B6U91_02015 [Candidatus Pacearchaeota archaeon ex4484_71]|nr:MAG: hypothetical protein B6U91_02015 [Candidatus Pacearchaeota archaeon ex4484_71]
MAEVLGKILELSNLYSTLVSHFPLWAQNFINLFLLVFLIFVYSVFIWKLYRFMARRDILPSKFARFRITNRPFIDRVAKGTTYFLKNIIIFPILIFFWYLIFTLFLIFLTEGVDISKILLISAIIIASIRAAAYYKEDLAKDLAKLLPFTLLGVYIIQSVAFNFSAVLTNISQIPSLVSKIAIYYLFILALEIVLRFFEIIFVTSGVEKEEEVKKVEE